MRKYLAAALLGLLFVSAAGCAGTKDAGEQPAETENGTENEAEEEDASGGLKASEGELSEEGRSAYHSVLLDVYFNHLFPNDRDYGFLEGADVSENEFAVCDVDQDGAAELLISYTTTDEAGKAALIYDFESALDMVREEFSGYPPLTSMIVTALLGSSSKTRSARFPSATPSSRSTRSLFIRSMTTSVSGSPMRQLYSMTIGSPFTLISPKKMKPL